MPSNKSGAELHFVTKALQSNIRLKREDTMKSLRGWIVTLLPDAPLGPNQMRNACMPLSKRSSIS